MGTSSHNPGQSGHSPLVPSWVDDEQENNNSLTAPIAPDALPNRFSDARGNMTRFAGSRGEASNLRKAASEYVRSSTGGAHNAAKRLGSAKGSTAILFNTVGAFSSGGATAAQEYLRTYNLIGKRADQALRDITDLICPDGGTTNEGIVRDAYIDTISEIPELREINFEDLSPEQMMIVLKGCIARVVIGRLLNDIGNKVIAIPDSLKNIEKLKERMISFVEGIVCDAFIRLEITADNINQREAETLTVNVYEQVYAIFAEA